MTTNRKAAQLNGDKHYHGRQCRKNPEHGTLRYTTTGSCWECMAIISRSPEKKAYDQKLRSENKERFRARRKKYYEANRERMCEKSAIWHAANPEKSNAIKKSYKARRRQQEAGGDSTKEIYAWEKAAPKVCHWCGKKCAKEYHIDHYQPLSKGGKHVVSNLVIACKTCNLRKSAKDPYDFAASVGRLF